MILSVDNLHAHYGKSHVLQGVAFHVGNGELVTLLGRNGAGKTTTLKSIVGVVPPSQGKVTLFGHELQHLPPHAIARQGVCLVPEHRGIFKLLTVEENLLLGQRKHSPWQLEDVYRIFPRLKERRKNGGGQLSGGEQQMLAIGRALMNDPKLLMLDEPVEGLAPVIVEEIVAQLKTIKAAGVAILLVEQKLAIALDISERLYVMGHGRIVFEGTPAALESHAEVRKEWLEV